MHSNLKNVEYSNTVPVGHFLVFMIYDYNLKQKMYKTVPQKLHDKLQKCHVGDGLLNK